jgi:hypothetical protein
MVGRLRALARRLLGVTREPTYFLPWLCRTGLDCVLLVNNVEARFLAEHRAGPFPFSAVQYDADGAVVGRYAGTLSGPMDTAEIALARGREGHGFVTVDVSRLQSDLYVALTDATAYAATHGRQEFIERYPRWTRVVMGALGATLALAGRTIPAFVRHQYVYAGPESRSHLLLLNLSNVPNRIRVTARREGAATHARLIRVAPMGAALVDAAVLADGAPDSTVLTLTLQGNAWFNLYLVGAGPRDLAGPLSLMHVK